MKLNAAVRREIKAQARACLLSRLPYCILAFAVYLVPTLFVSMLTAVPLDANLGQLMTMLGLGLACEILLLGPIMLGVQYFFVRISRGQTPPLSALFAPLAGARSVWRGIRMTLCLLLRTLLLMFVPTALYEAAMYGLLFWQQGGGLPLGTFVLLWTAVLLLYSLVMLPILGYLPSYWMGYAVLADDEQTGVWRATGTGPKLLRGQRWQMVAFTLSFLPWFLGGFLTCGLLTVFGAIYLFVSLYGLYDRLSGRQPDTPPQNPPFMG